MKNMKMISFLKKEVSALNKLKKKLSEQKKVAGQKRSRFGQTQRGPGRKLSDSKVPLEWFQSTLASLVNLIRVHK